ncbi:MAG: heavy metal translocating P-type ATPase [candidate division WOR-3 bacterium]
MKRKNCCEKCDIEIKKEDLEEKRKNLKEIIVISISLILFLSGILISKKIVLLIAYIISGEPIIRRAIRNILKGNFFDENTLMSVATIGAILINEVEEAVVVALFYRVGEFLQSISIQRSKRRIKKILELKPNFANIKRGDTVVRVKPEEVKSGEIIIVKPGEKVPLDGIIIKGESYVDTSPLTGESVPKFFKKGDEINAGVINKESVLEIKVLKEFKESSINKILELVEKAKEKKANPEKFITKFSKYYTPFVLIISFLIAFLLPLTTDLTIRDSIYRALVLLVISCPCALVISVPLSYFVGIGTCSKNGILVKGSNYLDILNEIKFFLFDKTGTLTEGVFKVRDIKNFNGFRKEEILEISAYAEANSNHPIAKAIKEYYGKEIKNIEMEEFSEKPGLGIKAKFKGRKVLVGSDRFLHENNIDHETCKGDGTTVHVVIDNVYAGYITISDEIRKEAKAVIENLKKLKIKIGMLTGDEKFVAEEINKKLNLDFFKAELLPEEKVKEIENLKNSHKVAFLGDGINDAAAIAVSDVGIAMGAMGQDAAIESSDIVIMDDNLSKIKKLFSISKKTKNIVFMNIIFAILIKVLFIYLGSIGIAKMWEAVFADMGVSIIAILNSMRIMKS